MMMNLSLLLYLTVSTQPFIIKKFLRLYFQEIIFFLTIQFIYINYISYLLIMIIILSYKIYLYRIRLSYLYIILPLLCYPSTAPTAALNTITANVLLQYVVTRTTLYAGCAMSH